MLATGNTARLSPSVGCYKPHYLRVHASVEPSRLTLVSLGTRAVSSSSRRYVSYTYQSDEISAASLGVCVWHCIHHHDADVGDHRA
jgi:hypothetical protein